MPDALGRPTQAEIDAWNQQNRMRMLQQQYPQAASAQLAGTPIPSTGLRAPVTAVTGSMAPAPSMVSDLQRSVDDSLRQRMDQMQMLTQTGGTPIAGYQAPKPIPMPMNAAPGARPMGMTAYTGAGATMGPGEAEARRAYEAKLAATQAQFGSAQEQQALQNRAAPTIDLTGTPKQAPSARLGLSPVGPSSTAMGPGQAEAQQRYQQQQAKQTTPAPYGVPGAATPRDFGVPGAATPRDFGVPGAATPKPTAQPAQRALERRSSMVQQRQAQAGQRGAQYKQALNRELARRY